MDQHVIKYVLIDTSHAKHNYYRTATVSPNYKISNQDPQLFLFIIHLYLNPDFLHHFSNCRYFYDDPFVTKQKYLCLC